MSKFYISYDNDELEASYTNSKGNNEVVKGEYLSAFLSMIEKLDNVKVTNNNDIIELKVKDDEIVIKDVNRLLRDNNYRSFASFLDKHIVKEEPKKEIPKKKKKINRGASLTAMGVGIVLIASVLNSQWDYMHGKELPNDFVNDYDGVKISDLFATPSPNITVLDFSKPITYEDYYNFLNNNYGEDINRYCKVYGVDPTLILKIACENGSITINKVFPDGRYGLMGLDIDTLSKNGVAAYNFSVNGTPVIELAPVNIDAVTDADYHFKISIMLFQQRLREYDNNIMAAIQSMGVTDRVFKEGIVRYGIEKYGDNLAYGEAKEKYYIDLVLSDYNDLGWLNEFVDEDGHTFLNDILSRYRNDTILKFKVCLNDQGETVLTYKVRDGHLLLDNGDKRLG